MNRFQHFILKKNELRLSYNSKLQIMKVLFSTIIILLFSSGISYSQLSYGNLSEFLTIEKDEITSILKGNSFEWEYVDNKIFTNSEKWVFKKSQITIINFNDKSLRKVKFYSEDFELFKKIVNQLGATNKFNDALVENYPSVIYNFWYGETHVAVGQILCSETDIICPVQFDLMNKKGFKKSDYK